MSDSCLRIVLLGMVYCNMAVKCHNPQHCGPSNGGVAEHNLLKFKKQNFTTVQFLSKYTSGQDELLMVEYL